MGGVTSNLYNGATNSEGDNQDLTAQQVSRQFAECCVKQYSHIELWGYKTLFMTLAEEIGQDDIPYWKPDTLIRFLGIPDVANVGDLMVDMTCYIAAFPFRETAPAPLDIQNILKVVTLFTGRTSNLLSPKYDRCRLIFEALAFSTQQESSLSNETVESQAINNDEKSEDTGLESLPYYHLSSINMESWSEMTLPNSKEQNATNLSAELDDVTDNENVRVSAKKVLDFFTFILAVMPLRPTEPIAMYVENFNEQTYKDFRDAATTMLRSVDLKVDPLTIDKSSGFTYSEFSKAVNHVFPHILDPIKSLFERFLFAPSNIQKATSSSSSNNAEKQSPSDDNEKDELAQQSKVTTVRTSKNGQQVQDELTDLMSLPRVAQISSFLGCDTLYGRLVRLYKGSEDGFSIHAFETKVFKWSAPTILIIRGSLLGDSKAQHFTPLPLASRAASENSLIDSASSDRLFPSNTLMKGAGNMVIYGCYIQTPWKMSAKKNFGDSSVNLFQLYPIQDVFKASSLSPEYAYFSQSAGIGFGELPPNTRLRDIRYNLGNVSLTLEQAFEYGVFRHVGAGGAFYPSTIRSYSEWQDLIQISEVEVWGCGGNEELEKQAKAWAYEEREALRRRYVNLTGTDEDRALLEMAGLVGQHQSGGSV